MIELCVEEPAQKKASARRQNEAVMAAISLNSATYERLQGKKRFWVPMNERLLDRIITEGEENGIIRPGMSVLEWGSANGAASLIWQSRGYMLCGIELDIELLQESLVLAPRQSRTGCRQMQFHQGSYFTPEYAEEYRKGSCAARRIEGILRQNGEWDDKMAAETLHFGEGDVYSSNGFKISDFDIIYSYLWRVQVPSAIELFTRYARHDAVLCLGDSYYMKAIRRELPVVNAFFYVSQEEECHFLRKR